MITYWLLRPLIALTFFVGSSYPFCSGSLWGWYWLLCIPTLKALPSSPWISSSMSQRQMCSGASHRFQCIFLSWEHKYRQSRSHQPGTLRYNRETCLTGIPLLACISIADFEKSGFHYLKASLPRFKPSFHWWSWACLQKSALEKESCIGKEFGKTSLKYKYHSTLPK